MNKVAVFLSVPVAVGALALWLLCQGIIRFNYPSFEEFPVQGIDMSHHQEEIDWTLLKGRSVQFVYIKASEGIIFRDPKFVANWNAAIKAGIVPGAYHFFTLCQSGEKQAKNFIAALREVETEQSLAPAIDLEFGGNCRARPSAEQFNVQLEVFLDRLRAVTPCPPVLYVTQEFYYPYVAGRFQNTRLWVRDIYMKPRLKDEARWHIWQFANRGHLLGVSTFVDLNVFNGSLKDFNRFRCVAMKANVVQ